ncbi:aspartyl protease family protein 2-like [Lotus japonicus]|uniref:aspartyl protease family protein 2-like n=1 Tax=Lotus japonicus TaxID=34305 RepID=UPI002582775C|nr:aspartyl protease family protein 2-like [Lotus japonicus]
MEEKVQNSFLFFLLVIFLTVFTASSDSFPSLIWPESEPLEFDPESSNTLTLPLHHVDVLFFNKTSEELFYLMLQRDAARVKAFTSKAAGEESNKTQLRFPRSRKGFRSPIISGFPHGTGAYYTRIGIGTPPRYVNLFLDTGSDVIWLQCKPCKICYNQTDEIFDPEKSTSFDEISCNSSLCQLQDQPGCNQKNQCQYQVTYGDGSGTSGDLSTETLTVGKTRLQRITFGCGHDNEGDFGGTAGLMGIGGGSLSFLGQVGTRFNKKFSYCLVDRSHSQKPSSIIFGDSAIPRTARFTPLLKNPNPRLNGFYYVELLGISVDGIPVRGISPSLFRFDQYGNGGVIIDSGTTVTQLIKPAYLAFRNAFRVAAAHLKRGPETESFDTCYDLSGLREAKVPTVVLHFRDVDVSLPAKNVLATLKTNKTGPSCFAFAQWGGPFSIIGNIQQQGIRIAYDLAGSRVGFAPRECV